MKIRSQYMQKLLVMLIEYGFVEVSEILNEATVSQCFKLLEDLSNVNVSNVKLCLALASAPEMDTKILCKLDKVVRNIGNLLEFVAVKEMEDYLEPTLGLCRAFIIHGIGSSKYIALSKEPALLVDKDFGMSIAVDQQCCIKDVGDFGANMEAFLELIGNSEVQIAALASDCLVLLLEAAPREATKELLTKLPKISSLLEELNQDASWLQLLRLLYGLAFSFKQYLSQGLILPISLPALAQIEDLVSALKSSPVRTVADAAFCLSKEIQRLPHCV